MPPERRLDGRKPVATGVTENVLDETVLGKAEEGHQRGSESDEKEDRLEALQKQELVK